ncbi:MAG: molybdopterin molybdotransferase MoeA [Solirubrobacteraceae bacterium]
MGSSQLIEIDAARELVLGCARRLGSEQVALSDALGRVLAVDTPSPQAVPPFDNSAMDGFAVRSVDVREAGPQAPVRLRIVDESRAGRPAQRELGPREAIAISTGAAMPEGADAVVPVERTASSANGVEILASVTAGNDVRHAGDDLRAGELVMGAGGAIGAAQLGALASVGADVLECVRRPRVSLVVTGDELIEPGESPRAGAIYDCNAFSVGALARSCGAELAHTARIADDPSATRAGLTRALQGSDVLVVCGGMSVGAHDHVRQSLAALEVRERFWGIALKPGKPTSFGTRAGTLVFGLPGNPVSAMVTFGLLVAPALRALQGEATASRRTYATLGEDYAKPAGRAHAVRARLLLTPEGWQARPTGDQRSHILGSMLGADALALIPTSVTSVRAGERVEVLLLEGAYPTLR